MTEKRSGKKLKVLMVIFNVARLHKLLQFRRFLIDLLGLAINNINNKTTK